MVRVSGTEAGRLRGRTLRRDQHSIRARKLLKLSIRINRDRFDIRKHNYLVLVLTQHEGAVVDLSNLSERIVVKKVDVVTSRKDRRQQIRSDMLTQHFDQLRI